MTILLGYLAGLLTLINPCVLPVLPIVLASSIQKDRRAPIALAMGMSFSFVALGLGLSALGPTLGLDSDAIARGAALVMAGFGLVMLTPVLSRRFAVATAGFARTADAQIDAQTERGLLGHAASGALLGAVWSPCIGPTLGAAIALASTGDGLFQAGLTMAAFAAGVSTLIIGLAYSARSALMRRRALLHRLAEVSRPIMGATFLIIGVGLWFRVHHVIEAWAIENLPAWLIDLSVSL